MRQVLFTCAALAGFGLTLERTTDQASATCRNECSNNCSSGFQNSCCGNGYWGGYNSSNCCRNDRYAGNYGGVCCNNGNYYTSQPGAYYQNGTYYPSGGTYNQNSPAPQGNMQPSGATVPPPPPSTSAPPPAPSGATRRQASPRPFQLVNLFGTRR